MVDLSIIEEVLEEQKQEMEFMADENICQRNEESQIDINSRLAQVVVGVRRSGKSTMCFNTLKRAGVQFAYVDFDDDRFAGLMVSDLNNVLLVLHKIYGDFKYLFLDEVQDIDGWHLFVGRLLRQRIHIIITGSNAKMLSGELATHLTGRSTETVLYPFSFKEFCIYKNVDVKSITTKSKGFRLASFDEYLLQGGFPELFNEKNSEKYINGLVHKIVINDIVKRNKIKYRAAFENLVHHVLNTIPAKMVYTDLQDLFKFKSNHTPENYVDFAAKAYLISLCRKYSPKSSIRVRDPKAYPIDVAFMNNRKDALVGDNLGWRLETIVYIELLRRNTPLGRNVFYYEEAACEADFVICKGNNVEEIYQVSYDISKKRTRDREIKGLILAAKATGCHNLTLVTRLNSENIKTEDGFSIAIVPAAEWLIDTLS